MKRHPLRVVEDVAAQSGAGSRQRKRELIEDWFNDDGDSRPNEERELWRVVVYALNPWYNYYVATVPGLTNIASTARKRSKQSKKGRMIFEDDVPKVYGLHKQFETMFQLLDDLKDRKLPPNSDAARHAILRWAEHCDSETIDLFRRIIQKDLRWGLQSSSLNAIYKGWVPAFKVQLAQPFDERQLKFPCYVDPKFDGERCLAFINYKQTEPEVTYFSRNGNQFFNYGCFDEELVKVFKGEGNVVVDCEVIDKAGFQTLMKVPKYHDPNFDTSGLLLVVFDWIPQADFESSEFDLPQEKRYAHLKGLFKGHSGRVAVVDTRLAQDWQEAEKIYDHWVAEGLEGIILKQPDGNYEFKRSFTWMKVKRKASDEFKVVGIQMGDKDKQWAGKCGSLLVERTNNEGRLITVGVASGLSHYHHENIVEVDDKILYTRPDGEVVNIKGQPVEVIYDCLTEDGSLRFPRIKPTFDLIRTDKMVK